MKTPEGLREDYISPELANAMLGRKDITKADVERIW